MKMKDLQFGEEIEGLKQELLNLGYHQYQVDNLVRETVRTTNFAKLPSEDLAILATALRRHLDFARKCYFS
jgi:hypothetical protein